MAGIYIHIPFCKKACNYCNFHFSTQLGGKTAVLQAIQEEIRRESARLAGQQVATVYIGGGTPSLLSRVELEALLGLLREQMNILGDAEITLEANPDDIRPAALSDWLSVGINRLSIGVQSFREEDLVWMNRAHSSLEAKSALSWVREAGFTNFSIDLIYGIPGLSDRAWQENLETALEYSIPHLSCYALTVEDKTALGHLVKTRKVPDTDPEHQSRQFLQLMERMRGAGYEHYEISNFAFPGYRSRHNSAYWKGETYLGLGPGAHSYDGKFRRWNVSNNGLYVKAIESGSACFEQEELSLENRKLEYLMTSLRTIEGVQLDYFASQFGQEELQMILTRAKEYLALTRNEGPVRLILSETSIQLTDEGRCFADGITAFF